MDKKKKIIGSITIAVLLIVMMVIGYKLSQPKVITEDDMEILIDNSKNTSLEKGISNTDKQDSLNNIEDSKSENKGSSIEGNDSKKETSSKIVVQIQGEVKNPGIYDLEVGSRVRDLIEAAGGLTENADKSINQALKLKDEDSVTVYKVGEYKENAVPVNNAASGNSGSSNNIKSGNNNEDKNNTDKKIDINSATKEELMTLKGIGESYSERIIEYRETKGPFKNIEELKNIKGIGEKTFENIKDSIEVR